MTFLGDREIANPTSADPRAVRHRRTAGLTTGRPCSTVFLVPESEPVLGDFTITSASQPSGRQASVDDIYINKPPLGVDATATDCMSGVRTTSARWPTGQ